MVELGKILEVLSQERHLTYKIKKFLTCASDGIEKFSFGSGNLESIFLVFTLNSRIVFIVNPLTSTLRLI